MFSPVCFIIIIIIIITVIALCVRLASERFAYCAIDEGIGREAAEHPEGGCAEGGGRDLGEEAQGGWRYCRA